MATVAIFARYCFWYDQGMQGEWKYTVGPFNNLTSIEAIKKLREVWKLTLKEAMATVQLARTFENQTIFLELGKAS